nr:hypothetical protein [Methylobacterium sp. ZNC0032]
MTGPHKNENPPAVENADGHIQVDLAITREIAPAVPAGKIEPEPSAILRAARDLAARLFEHRRGGT